MPLSEVFNMDCMEGMKQYPDKYFDLVIDDSPYFSGPEKRQFYGEKVTKSMTRVITQTVRLRQQIYLTM